MNFEVSSLLDEYENKMKKAEKRAIAGEFIRVSLIHE